MFFFSFDTHATFVQCEQRKGYEREKKNKMNVKRKMKNTLRENKSITTNVQCVF